MKETGEFFLKSMKLFFNEFLKPEVNSLFYGEFIIVYLLD